MKKKALVLGITGQDGSYLSKHLLAHGYVVVGTTRNAHSSTIKNLHTLGIQSRVQSLTLDLNDNEALYKAIKDIQPSHIFNLSGQSSVGYSFIEPGETYTSIVMSTLNCLEAIRKLDKSIRYYSAGSGEMFGNCATPAIETSAKKPISPYAIAKNIAHDLVSNYRNDFGLHASTGYLFNHESPLRDDKFVTKKIIKTAIRIKLGDNVRLSLGNLDIIRDWGWAPEFVEAMRLMSEMPTPGDYIIATGTSHSLKYFVASVFDQLGLHWENFVDIEAKLIRPKEIYQSHANPTKAYHKLRWKSEYDLTHIISAMIEDELSTTYNPQS